MLDTSVLISSSPIPSHPSPHIIAETIRSVRHHLKTEPIYVMCDGLRPEQEDRRRVYDEYKQQMVGRMLSTDFDNVVVLPFPEFQHQAVMTIRTMFMVKTPLVLFVEHDTPLVERPIDWDFLSNALENGATNHIRLHYDETIHPDHQHMMCGKFCPNLIKTVQYHNRPFLTKSDWFGQLLVHYFGPESRTWIEDKLYSPVSTSKWEDFKLCVYDPNGNGQLMKRSRDIDGRAEDIKYDPVF